MLVDVVIAIRLQHLKKTITMLIMIIHEVSGASISLVPIARMRRVYADWLRGSHFDVCLSCYCYFL